MTQAVFLIFCYSVRLLLFWHNNPHDEISQQAETTK